MPNYCCVPGCKRQTGGHQFPKDPSLRMLWRVAIKRVDQRTKELWTPTVRDVVCHEHFTADDYTETLLGERKRLKKCAVPTVFNLRPPSLNLTRMDRRKQELPGGLCLVKRLENSSEPRIFPLKVAKKRSTHELNLTSTTSVSGRLVKSESESASDDALYIGGKLLRTDSIKQEPVDDGEPSVAMVTPVDNSSSILSQNSDATRTAPFPTGLFARLNQTSTESIPLKTEPIGQNLEQCFVCGKIFTTKSLLMIHAIEHTQGICSTDELKTEGMTEHQIKNDPVNIMMESPGQKRIYQKRTYMYQTNEEKFKSKATKLIMPKPPTVKVHSPDVWECNLCQKFFLTQGFLLKHAADKHLEELKRNTGQKLGSRHIPSAVVHLPKRISQPISENTPVKSKPEEGLTLTTVT